MKKILNSAFYWVVLPGLFAASIALGDHQLALVGATFLWAVALVLSALATVALAVMLMTKPTDPKWSKNKEAVLKDRPGVIRRAIGWLAMGATVALCAYTGFVVTAVFYLIGHLGVRVSYFMITHHLENAENAQA